MQVKHEDYFTRHSVTPQDIGLQLIRVSRLDEVSQLLSQPELAPLRPALLLLGWDIYLTEGSGKELTVALWPTQVRGKLKQSQLHVFSPGLPPRPA